MSKIIKSSSIKVLEDKKSVGNTENNVSKKSDSDENAAISAANIFLNEASMKRDMADKYAEEMKLKTQIEAGRVMSEAEMRAKLVEEEAIQKAEQAIMESKAKGYLEGIEEGREAGFAEYNSMLQELQNMKDEFLEWKDMQIQKLESDIVDMVILSVEKILHLKLEEDKSIMIEIIKSNLKKLNFIKQATLRVSVEDYTYLEKVKPKLLMGLENISELEIKANSDMEKGDLIIETESGIINPGISFQIDKLKKELIRVLQSEE